MLETAVYVAESRNTLSIQAEIIHFIHTFPVNNLIPKKSKSEKLVILYLFNIYNILIYNILTNIYSITFI